MSGTDTASLTVLIADDDPAALRLTKRIAAMAGYHVLQAQNGHEALERILSDHPDMVITDWDMPGLSGVQLCRELRQRGLPFYVYVLLVTAKSRSEELVEGLEAGADDFITKPIDPAGLIARLRAGARTVAMEHHLREMARSDPLTGAMNRRTFFDRLAVEWDRAERYQQALSCVVIDLDYFKRINDTYGHAAGDAMLQAVARLLEGGRRVSDIVARCGGEEYFVLLPGTDEEEAATWSERVRRSLADLQVPFAGHTLGLTGSFGVASRLADTGSPEALLALADQALGVAKEAGRNRVVCFSSLADPGLHAADRPAARVPLHNVLARDVLAPAVYCPHVNDTIDRVADQFLQMRLNAAPVVDDSGRLAGIVSENDLLTAIASGGRDQQTIQTCMKTNVVQYEEHTPVKEIFRFLSRAAVPRVVVVHQNRPTGVISRATLLRWLRNWTDVHPRSEPPINTISFGSRRAGILRAADVAEDRLDALRQHLAEPDADFVPCAVAEATRLEELAHDILAHCRGQERV